MEIILNDSTNVSLQPCEKCWDWWDKVEHGNKYPISPGGNIKKVDIMELTFGLMSNSLRDLDDWYRKKKSKDGVFAHDTKYTKMLGIRVGLVNGKGLIASLGDGLPLVESESYPEI